MSAPKTFIVVILREMKSTKPKIALPKAITFSVTVTNPLANLSLFKSTQD